MFLVLAIGFLLFGFVILTVGQPQNKIEIAKLYVIASCALALIEIAQQLATISSKLSLK